jgi:CTP-dependent riboflavin kinase
MLGKTGPPNTTGGKQWWAPIWTGLVMDREAKHLKKIKSAVWLYLYLVLNANRSSGFLMRKIRTISADMGISKTTITRWLNVLRKHGYIATQNTGRCLLIQIQRWKTLKATRNLIHQMYQNPYIRSTKNGASDGVPKTGKYQVSWRQIGDILRP